MPSQAVLDIDGRSCDPGVETTEADDEHARSALLPGSSRYNTGALLAIDTETLTIVQEIPIPAYVHGVSIDFVGYVWGVQFSGNSAYRVDPMTQTIDTFAGLSGAYTYSDMTGFALSAAGVPTG